MANTQHNHYRNLVRSIVKKLTGSFDEDLEQEIFLKAWQNKDKYVEEGKADAWIRTLSVNVTKDYFRSKFFKEKQKIPASSQLIEKLKVPCSIEKKIDARKRQKIILNEVNNLCKDLKTVVILYEFEEKTYQQIADRLNLPIGTIKSRLFSARKILSKKLKFLKGNDYE